MRKKSNVQIAKIVLAHYQEKKGAGGLRRLSEDLYGVDTKHSTLSEYFKYINNQQTSLSPETLERVEKEILLHAYELPEKFPGIYESNAEEAELLSLLARLSKQDSLFVRWLQKMAKDHKPQSTGSTAGIMLSATAIGTIATLFAGPIGMGIGAIIAGFAGAAAGKDMNDQLKVLENVLNLRNSFKVNLDGYQSKLLDAIKIVQVQNELIEHNLIHIKIQIEADIKKLGLPKQNEIETLKEFEKILKDVPTLNNLFLIPSDKESHFNTEKIVKEIFHHITNPIVNPDKDKKVA